MDAKEALATIFTMATLASYLFYWLGVISHYAKKCYKDDIHWVEYWTAHKQSTMSSILVGHGAFFGVILGAPGQATALAVFGIGWSIDSAVNKHK